MIFNIENPSIIRTIGILVVFFIIYIILSLILKRYLSKKVRTKKARHNVVVFINILTYSFFLIAILFIFLSYFSNLAGIGIAAGLLTAALGWALQRPITGIAAWLMIIITRPFSIGDRIIIGGVKGDVINITITHIYLEEFGGTIGGEEISGRIIIIPNAVLFEQNVINYTSQNEYILDEVAFTITYKSHIEIAKKIAKDSALKIVKDFLERSPMKPFIRTNFQASGVDLRIRYYTIASKRQEVQSKITEEIFKKVMKEKKVEFAYPHTKVILDK